jgi:WD40 repeat protein
MEDRVLSLAFSPDSGKLITGGGEPSRNGELILWDVASGSVVRKFTEAHSDTVFDVEFSRDGKRLVSGAADKFVKLFNVETGELIRGYEGHTGHVLSVSIKADDSSLVSGGADFAVKLWNLDTGEQRRTMNNFQKEVTAVDYIGATDNFVSSGGDKTVRLFTASNGNNFRSFTLPDFVYTAVASRDQNVIVGAGEDGTVYVWNGQNGQELMKFAPPVVEVEAQAAAN